jgi:hypothetical protein
MRIVLFSTPYMTPAFKGWRPPNLAVSFTAENLMDYYVYLVDLILVRQKLTSAIKNILLTYRPELIGISSMSFQFHTTRRIASCIKDLDSNIKIVCRRKFSAYAIERVIKGIFNIVKA